MVHTWEMETERMERRIPFATTADQVERIDRWRGLLSPIPSRNDAIRQLVDYALEMKAREAAARADGD
jgi:hypothetical protein